MSSKSGSETTETTLPSWLQEPVQRNLQRAEDLQRMPFMPYRGAEIAAFNPNQVSAFQNNIDAAKAFGFNAPVDAMGGMPEASKYADGSFGYDSNSLYDQALLDSQAYDPAAFNKYQSFFDTSVGANPNPNPVPNGIASLGGGGGGNGNKDFTYQETLDEINKIKADQNYFGAISMKDDTSPFTTDYPNYTPTTPYSNPLLDQKGATPSVPYSNPMLDQKGATPQSNSSAYQSMDDIVAQYRRDLGK